MIIGIHKLIPIWKLYYSTNLSKADSIRAILFLEQLKLVLIRVICVKKTYAFALFILTL
jgi:hypothetical protein